MNSKLEPLKKIKLSIVSLIAFSFFQQSCIETTINPFEDEVELFQSTAQLTFPTHQILLGLKN